MGYENFEITEMGKLYRRMEERSIVYRKERKRIRNEDKKYDFPLNFNGPFPLVYYDLQPRY
jgi:hypothetical protein